MGPLRLSRGRESVEIGVLPFDPRPLVARMVEVVVQIRAMLLRRAVFESDEGFGGAPGVEQLTSDPGGNAGLFANIGRDQSDVAVHIAHRRSPGPARRVGGCR